MPNKEFPKTFAVLLIAVALFASCAAPENTNANANTNTNDTPVNEPPEISEKYWKLTELFGKPVPPPAENSREAHMVIRKEDNKVNGNSGCNNFFGTYTLGEGNRITFSQLGATKMACLDGMEVETQFFDALEKTDNYSLRGDSLLLNKAKMAPLARFVAVDLR